MYFDVLSRVELETLSRKSGARSGVHPEQIVPQYSSRWERPRMVELATSAHARARDQME
jgi:hypothetical protein